jgi:hypothetical protein
MADEDESLVEALKFPLGRPQEETEVADEDVVEQQPDPPPFIPTFAPRKKWEPVRQYPPGGINTNRIPMPKGAAAEAALMQLAVNCLKTADPQILKIVEGMADGTIVPKPRPEPEQWKPTPTPVPYSPPPKKSLWARARAWLGQWCLDLRIIKRRASR